jgi:23S rRNA pseudouridine2605 synthase
MRINKFIARATGISRREADKAIEAGRVTVNGQPALTGTDVTASDDVMLDGKTASQPRMTTIMLNKPAGYVCSRDGQGARTVYDLLPEEFKALKPVGRLDKDSSGLLLLTTDGDLANRLTHPSYQKEKIYQVTLDHPLTEQDRTAVQQGVNLDDGPSALRITDVQGARFTVTMSEGRNRQIRRTFAALGYEVNGLHRTQFGSYALPNSLAAGSWLEQGR